MTRKFLDTISADIDGLLADNLTGDISGADLQGILGDMVDSLKQDEAVLSSTGPSNGYATTTAMASIASAYGSAVGGDAEFLKTVVGSGTITGTSTPGFSYGLKGQVRVSASNNVAVLFSIGVNGSPVGFVGAAEGSGLTEYYTVSIEHFLQTAAADDVFTLMVQTPQGNDSINIADIELIAEILPTNNP